MKNELTLVEVTGFRSCQRFLGVCFAGYFFAMFLPITVRAYGASVTLQFDAFVGPPNTVNPMDVPFILPFEYHQGDALKCEITVNPIDVAPDVASTSRVENAPAKFTIGGVTIATSQYSISVRDNVDALDVPVSPYDEIVLGCSPFSGALAVCSPNVVNADNNIIWGFTIGFSADADRLHGADIPGDAATWNSFDRGLAMSFREKNGPGIMRLNATIGPFLQVPEPSPFALPALGAVFCRSRSRRYRLRF